MQIVWSFLRGSCRIAHLGFAPDESEVEGLKAAARQRLKEVAGLQRRCCGHAAGSDLVRGLGDTSNAANIGATDDAAKSSSTARAHYLPTSYDSATVGYIDFCLYPLEYGMWEQSYYDMSIAASRQCGLITSAQMKRLGVDDALVDHFRRFALIRELDWAVYQISGSSCGPRYALPYAGWLAILPDSFGWERLGALADDVVLSHESASALLGIGSMASTSMRFTSSKERMVPHGVRIEVSPLTPDEVMIYEGVPVATPHRVILDLVTEGASQEEISGVVTDAVERDLVDLRMLFEDLAPMAEQYGFPSHGGHFIDYFLPDVPPGPLSRRNIRAYSEIAFPHRISDVRPHIDRILVSLRGEHSLRSKDVGISSEIAAEIVGRVEGGR